MRLLNKYLYIRIFSADPEFIISKLAEANIEVYRVIKTDDICSEFYIVSKQYVILKDLLEKTATKGEIIGRSGFLWHFHSSLYRPVLLIGLILFLIITVTVPQRILFIRVTGAETVSEDYILQQAENAGIVFASKASLVRSEETKNYLLRNIPQLQWIGVITSGCIATIHVKERSTVSDINTHPMQYSNIIATMDGIITELMVYDGIAICKTGQSVKENDLLISGYQDLGIKHSFLHAEGEVYAHTVRKLQMIAPSPVLIRGEPQDAFTVYQLLIGKKLINLYNPSSIPDSTCVKMYSEKCCVFPGNFSFPVSLIKTEYMTFMPTFESLGVDTDNWLPLYAHSYLQSQMVAGRILNEVYTLHSADGICIFNGNYACHEMIGQAKYEEITERHAEDN